MRRERGSRSGRAGGCRNGWGRLLSVTNTIGPARKWRPSRHKFNGGSQNLENDVRTFTTYRGIKVRVQKKVEPPAPVAKMFVSC